MATAKQFEDLGVWQDARVLVKEIDTGSKQRAFYRDFGLRDQIRRAATSTMSNIAAPHNRKPPRRKLPLANTAADTAVKINPV